MLNVGSRLVDTEDVLLGVPAGFPYDTHYFWCLFCDLRFCVDCSGAHPSAHQSYYKWLLDRATPRGALPTQRSCLKCKKLSHCRLGCEECELNFCIDCAANSRDSLVNHGHRKLVTTRAPDDYGVSSYNLECGSCQAGATLSHCGRCGTGIKRRQTFWACVTCVKDYNGQIRFCEECQVPGRQEHDLAHKFASFQYRVDMNLDPKYSNVRCVDCKQTVSFNGQSLARHPHTSFQITVGEAERDRRVYHNYRTCLRKPVRDIATVSAESHSLLCHCCNQRFSLNARIFVCPSCTLMTCATCTEIGGARSHPHIMIPVALNRSMPPDDLWKQLAMSSLFAKVCEKCDKTIAPETDSYIQCNHCRQWNICFECTKKRNIPVRHTCVEDVEMTLFDPVDRGSSWLAMQISVAQRAMLNQPQSLAMLPGQVGHTVPPGQPVSLSSGMIHSQMIQQQQSAIKRKPTSSGSSAASPISPLPSAPIQPPLAPETSSPILTSFPPSGSPSTTNQTQPTQTASPYGLTHINLLARQSSIAPIQPSIQAFMPPSDIKRKALSPKIESASRVVYDKTSSASRAMYDRASSIAKEIDTDAVKKVGKGFLKGTAKVAGAVGSAVLRNEVQQATGVQLPVANNLGRISNRPNPQQFSTMDPQTQQQIQMINKLNAQVQLAQRIKQLQQAQAAAAAQSGGASIASSNTPLQSQMNSSNLMAPISASQISFPVQLPEMGTSVPAEATLQSQDTIAPIPACELNSTTEIDNVLLPIPSSEQIIPETSLNPNEEHPTVPQEDDLLESAPESTAITESHIEVDIECPLHQTPTPSQVANNAAVVHVESPGADSQGFQSDDTDELNQHLANVTASAAHAANDITTSYTLAGNNSSGTHQISTQHHHTSFEQSVETNNYINVQHGSHTTESNQQANLTVSPHTQCQITAPFHGHADADSNSHQIPTANPAINSHNNHGSSSPHQPFIGAHPPSNGIQSDTSPQSQPTSSIGSNTQAPVGTSTSVMSSTADATPQTSGAQPVVLSSSSSSPLPSTSTTAAAAANTPHLTINMPAAYPTDAAAMAQQQQQMLMANSQINQQSQQIQQLQQQINMMAMQQQQQQQQHNAHPATQQTIDNLQMELLSNQLQQQEQQQQQQTIDMGLSILNSIYSAVGQNGNNDNNQFLSNVYGNNNQVSGLDLVDLQNSLNAQLAAINNIEQSGNYLAMQQMANDDIQTNLELQQLNNQLAAINFSASIDDSHNQFSTSDLFTGNVDVNVNMDIASSFGGDMSGVECSESVVIVSQDDTNFGFQDF